MAERTASGAPRFRAASSSGAAAPEALYQDLRIRQHNGIPWALHDEGSSKLGSRPLARLRRPSGARSPLGSSSRARMEKQGGDASPTAEPSIRASAFAVPLVIFRLTVSRRAFCPYATGRHRRRLALDPFAATDIKAGNRPFATRGVAVPLSPL
jgi:hypothetical protein